MTRTLFALALVGCAADDGVDSVDTTTADTTAPLVPEFGSELVVFGDSSDDLSVPRDLGFNPASEDQLWTVNQATDAAVIFFDPGTADQESEERHDSLGYHFMEEVSSIAFTDADTFGTCQESRNTYNDSAAPNNFMGPTLWPADLDLFAEVNQKNNSPLLGSHLDMLHESPQCMGIAWDHDNIFWVFDGFHDEVVYYDFQVDHGTGGDDHSDGIVRTYPEAELERVEGVPGHMELDHETGWLYVANTGKGRITRLDTATGEETETLRQKMEPLDEYTEYTGATVETFVKGFDEPSGLAIQGGRLFVGDHGTGEIIAFDLETGDEIDRMQTDAKGLMGLEFGPDGALWYVDGAREELVRVEPAG